MTGRPEIRPATAEDIHRFTDGEMRWSCRALAADLEGEILAIGGVYYCGPHVVAFSQFDERLRDYPATLARMAFRIMDIVKQRSCIAVADDKYPGSEKLLTRMGFEHVEGRVYAWPTQ